MATNGVHTVTVVRYPGTGVRSGKVLSAIASCSCGQRGEARTVRAAKKKLTCKGKV